MQIGGKIGRQGVQLAIAQDLVHARHGRAVAEFVDAALKNLDDRLEFVDVDLVGNTGLVVF
ncbi:hypothetical protein D3C78_1968330 [compost metagenome]